MTDSPPPFPTHRRSLATRPSYNRVHPAGIIGFLILLLIAGIPIFIWYGCRIEPSEGNIAVLIRKTGKDLPTGQILATEEGQKGIQLEVLAEGRHWRNPYVWNWEIHPITDIPAGKLGVQTRLFGKDLPSGQILATEGSKGILADVLMPGRYRVNPYAYSVEPFDAITVRAGHVGVMTSLVGADKLIAPDSVEDANTFLVGPDTKGVVPEVKNAGTYYLNPYLVSLVEVNTQAQRFEMSGPDRITFLTSDGFSVMVEGTIEFEILGEQAAFLTHRVGDMEDIVKKIIMPRARGFSRIEGSKHPAINFIVGETRQQFQDNLLEELKARSQDWGVKIKSVLVRKIMTPDEIAAINRDRQVAVEEASKYKQQIEQAQSRAELTRQEMLALQNKEKVEAETERIRALINAQQAMEVQVIAAQKDLDVARLHLEAAKFEAEALLLKADGERAAVKADNEAKASVFAAEANALGGGRNLARLALFQHLAPRIETILSNDGGDGLGALFRLFMTEGKEVAP